jgi:hypothetical protein
VPKDHTSASGTARITEHFKSVRAIADEHIVINGDLLVVFVIIHSINDNGLTVSAAWIVFVVQIKAARDKNVRAGLLINFSRLENRQTGKAFAAAETGAVHQHADHCAIIAHTSTRTGGVHVIVDEEDKRCGVAEARRPHDLIGTAVNSLHRPMRLIDPERLINVQKATILQIGAIANQLRGVRPQPAQQIFR